MKEGFERVTVDTLGGLCTLMDPSDLPIGVASYANNVEFFPGGFRSRDGFKAYLADSGGVTGGFRNIYDYVDGLGTHHHITYQGGVGRLGSRTTGSTVNTVATKLGSSATAFTTMRATALYGRVYACVSDGRRGLMAPLQWDGVLPVSSIGASGANAPVVLFGGVGAFTTGRYFVVVAYETDTGYITGTTNLTYSSVGGGASNQMTINSIAIGPPGTAKRRIFISLVDSFELFNPAGLIIEDNTTTSLAGLSITAAEIGGGLPFENYVNLQPPTAHLGVEAYANRLVMWGGDGRIRPFFGPLASGLTPPYSSVGLINLDFGAMSPASYNFAVAGAYASWETAAPTAAVTVVAGSAAQGEVDNYLRFVSTGAALTIGQGATLAAGSRPNVDYLSNYFVAPGRRYGIRARVRKPVHSGTSYTVSVTLYEAAGIVTGTTIAQLSLNLTALDDDWAIYESDGSTTVAASANVAMIISLAGAGAPSIGDTVDISNIEIYDLEGKRGSSRLDISRVDDAESFDALRGVIDVSPNDGQEIRNVFPLKGNLYIFKENSTYVTQDTGDEPDTWSQEIVSSVVGTPSVHGVGVGESWLAIVARDGLYMFDGGAMQKISQEIQPTWESFDWTLGYQMYCAVDTAKQTIIVGGPKPGGKWLQLRLSYVNGFGDPISGSGNGRAWSTDEVNMVGAATIRIDDGSQAIAYCTGGTISANPGDTATSASVVYEDATSTADWNQPILASYRTAPIGGEMERSLFGQIAAKVRGSGYVDIGLYDPSSTLIGPWNRAITASPDHDVEVRCNATATQLAIGIGSAAAKLNTSYFVVKRMAVWLKKSPSASLRGY